MQMSGRQILVRRSGMKAPCMAKDQVYSHLEVFRCERINTAKQKDGLTFLMLSVLEANIFQYGFLEEHKMCVNNRY